MLFKPIDLSVSQKTEPFNKTIEVDSDKSISIRSFLIGAICQKISFVKNALESDDVISTINCLKNLGVKIKLLISTMISFFMKPQISSVNLCRCYNEVRLHGDIFLPSLLNQDSFALRKSIRLGSLAITVVSAITSPRRWPESRRHKR